jgi:chromosome segregation ATPase
VSEANVTNIEALERFRSSLVLFLERAGFVLDEVSEEVKRTRIWLQTEQSMKLGHEMKRRQRELEQLEQEMFTARLSDLAQKKTGMQMQINKKRREILELEGKIWAVKGWLRNFDSVVETEARKAEKLRQQIDIEMARAVTSLTESVKQLRAYSEDV